MERRATKVKARDRSSVPDTVVKGLERLTVDKGRDDEKINPTDIKIRTSFKS